jgi:phosphoglycerate dehydrogenase-like enzyme
VSGPDHPLLDVVIATPLEPALARRIGEHPNVRLGYEPSLLPPARYPGDHRGDTVNFHRSSAGQERWQSLLAGSEVLFGIPGDTAAGLAAALRRCPQLRLIQATSAGAAEQVTAAGLTDADLERVAVTTASGVHAGPLAEFAIMVLLAETRSILRIRADQPQQRWEHYATPDLEGRRLVILGTGSIGTRIARVAGALGMTTVGVNGHGGQPQPPFDELHPSAGLTAAAEGAGGLVVTVPLTEHTRYMVTADVFTALADDAVIINVGRGPVIDVPVLIAALRAGQIGGAALDVTTVEPLPATSPLWNIPHVLISPHTAALSDRENERVVELFCDNLTRLVDGHDLRNQITSTRGY